MKESINKMNSAQIDKLLMTFLNMAVNQYLYDDKFKRDFLIYVLIKQNNDMFAQFKKNRITISIEKSMIFENMIAINFLLQAVKKIPIEFIVAAVDDALSGVILKETYNNRFLFVFHFILLIFLTYKLGMLLIFNLYIY